jgi:glycosyltransferase involved in cell wall biosynthesis
MAKELSEKDKVMMARIEKRNARMKARDDAKLKSQLANNDVSPFKTNKDITIEICIHCYNYQHRLCWMLSSILQQTGNIPKIIVNISHSLNQGNPTTELVCEYFRSKGLNIEETILTDEEVPNRAIARNRQVKNTKSDWMLFADSDLVYANDFFEDLASQLRSNLKDIDKCMGADRHSLNDKFCIKYFEEDQRVYPCEVENVAEVAKTWPIKWTNGRMIAPGFFQLAKTKAIMDKGGIYAGRQKDKWRSTRSDRGFRCQMGGRIGLRVKSMWHLNHDRGGPEIQR